YTTLFRSPERDGLNPKQVSHRSTAKDEEADLRILPRDAATRGRGPCDAWWRGRASARLNAEEPERARTAVASPSGSLRSAPFIVRARAWPGHPRETMPELAARRWPGQARPRTFVLQSDGRLGAPVL